MSKPANTPAAAAETPSAITALQDKLAAKPAAASKKPAAEKPAASKKPSASKKPAASKSAAKPAAKPAAKTAAKPAAAKVEFSWPKPPAELLLDYLKANVSDAADAPNKQLPFISEDGILRVKGEHWRGWLQSQNIDAPKITAGAPLRSLLGPMKPYALPGEGRSFGFYTGKAPAGTKELPRRKVERAARTPRNPLGKLTDAQRSYLSNLITADERKLKDEVKAAREELLALLAG